MQSQLSPAVIRNAFAKDFSPSDQALALPCSLKSETASSVNQSSSQPNSVESTFSKTDLVTSKAHGSPLASKSKTGSSVAFDTPQPGDIFNHLSIDFVPSGEAGHSCRSFSF